MKISIFKTNMLLSVISGSLIKLPTPLNISIYWNFGSLLGLMLLMQIVTGLFLTMHYCPHTTLAFLSIIHIIQDVKYGWILRNFHMNGASMYFICLYLHVGRGLYYNSYKLKKVWFMGVMILLISMMTAFLGYVLPWGQMSFWGATVITNLLSAIPYLGEMIVFWLWGGFSINNATLNRFYTFHFILPFLILLMVMLHLLFLHETGSSNPMGLNSNLYKIIFHPFFSIKDLIGFLFLFFIMFILIFQYPYFLSDPDNFILSNSMKTPKHIQPEWYFLFAYAVLRSIPNKLGGVVALMMSILILLVLIMLDNSLINSNKFCPMNQILYWIFIMSFFILTWIGSKSISYPYVQISQICSVIYFMYFFMLFLLNFFWNKIIFN